MKSWIVKELPWILIALLIMAVFIKILLHNGEEFPIEEKEEVQTLEYTQTWEEKNRWVRYKI